MSLLILRASTYVTTDPARTGAPRPSHRNSDEPGEAGKGFAVVASEVKELAQETARATEGISRRVTTITSDTAGAVSAIADISSIIASIDDFQTTIAAAVEEQTATTNEMSRSRPPAGPPTSP